MVKQRNFLHAVDLSFDARFVKYYQLSLQYHKQCPMNNIQVKYSQIGQNILVDNDVNKVHRKFPIDTCLICLKFFPTIRCYYSDWFSFYFGQNMSHVF